ncbi:hypothetical protein Golob_022043 [Gossypium lobatum]|uniref:DUF4283 domain-containing protein n=1 Tax=Gossypium lobatum TaxID=34289 RepID=A0A7J8LFE6_9ROSI|nr:hypothetical protein [Gossypium lobatum]
MVVWVRFSRLPYRYYAKGLLSIISKVLGKIIKADYNTTKLKREYEGLPVICYECGCYGNTKESCSKQQENEKKVGLAELTVVPSIDTMPATIVGAMKDSISLYRLWMQAPASR